MPHELPRDIDFIQNLIRRKARKLVGRAGLRNQDRAEVEQELIARFLHRLARYPARNVPWQAVYAKALESSVVDFLRFRQAQRRDPQKTESLEERDEELTQQAHDRRHRRTSRNPAEQRDLSADLADLLKQASPEDRALVNLLLVHGKIAPAARAAGMARSTFAGRVRRLRERFEQADLQDYL